MQDRTIAGKYALKCEIGRGGMGVVCEAFDQALRRLVAIKLMTPEHATSATARRRFEREALAVAQLQNEHIVQIYDYGIDEGSPYIVMELLQGENLEARLNRERRLGAAATLVLLRQIAKGLEAANEAGIVHRDLKPANVFVARGASGESVKILDFGVVWTVFEALEEDQQAWYGGLIGTPPYMSPEQVRGVVPHHLSDLWSLGVIAYQALTGRLPFSGGSLGQMITSICTDSFQPPSSLVPGLMPGFDHFFERALAKDRAQRFPSARELVAAFAALCQVGRGPVKILVADDEPDVQLLMKLHFRQQIRDSVYEFIFADDGQAALDEIRRHPDIDVVLTDLDMPVMDGLTLLGRISEVNPMARTVIVTAYGDMRNIRCAMNRGAFDFLLKPIDFSDLEATVEKTLKHVAELRRNARSDEENHVLRQFTSPALVERIRALGPAAAMASEVMEVTVAFIDVFQFTPVILKKLPGEAMRLLNANFEVIVPELMAKGGVVDKFLGDAVMAVFHGPDHLGRALDACLAVREQLETMARRAGADSPYARGVCVGLSTGQVLSGGMGSHACGQLGFTVIGDAVNAAAHLARVAQPGEVLVEEAVQRAAGQAFTFGAAGVRNVWPREEPVVVYNVTRSEPAQGSFADESTVDPEVDPGTGPVKK